MRAAKVGIVGANAHHAQRDVVEHRGEEISLAVEMQSKTALAALCAAQRCDERGAVGFAKRSSDDPMKEDVAGQKKKRTVIVAGPAAMRALDALQIAKAALKRLQSPAPLRRSRTHRRRHRFMCRSCSTSRWYGTFPAPARVGAPARSTGPAPGRTRCEVHVAPSRSGRASPQAVHEAPRARTGESMRSVGRLRSRAAPCSPCGLRSCGANSP